MAATTKSRVKEKPEVITASGEDAFDMLEQMQSNGVSAEVEELPELKEPKLRQTKLPGGWEFSTWKQRQMMELLDTGFLEKGKVWPSYHRGHFCIVVAAIDAGCFAMPTGVTADTVLELDFRYVDQIAHSIFNHYLNLMATPKN